jgi:Fe-S cluster biogenesis protein NfuA/nitrite reductase/ring-hydroxylating ferredoxin subunit
MMEVVAQGGESGRTFEAFAEDELVSHLLLLHGLHPIDMETRVVKALEEVRPYLQSHGGNVELLGVEGGVARLRMQGSCNGCPSSAMTLKLAIEEAVQKAAPDLLGIEAEGVEEPPPKPATTFVAAPTLRKKEKKPEDRDSWTVVGGLPQLSGGGMLGKEISGEPVLFVKLEDDFYAYRHLCPSCGESLDRGSLKGAELGCPGCGRRYDVRRAGRCLDDPQLYLEPVPLLVSEEGIVKIALPSVVS